MGRPYMLPPKTPANVVKIMRTAFDAAMKDEDLKAEAQRRVLDLTLPMSGEEIHTLIDKLYAYPQTIIDKAVVVSDTTSIGKK
jgi:tripartite-type tricarboxylate transporter receptor subunit TctC